MTKTCFGPYGQLYFPRSVFLLPSNVSNIQLENLIPSEPIPGYPDLRCWAFTAQSRSSELPNKQLTSSTGLPPLISVYYAHYQTNSEFTQAVILTLSPHQVENHFPASYLSIFIFISKMRNRVHFESFSVTLFSFVTFRHTAHNTLQYTGHWRMALQ